MKSSPDIVKFNQVFKKAIKFDETLLSPQQSTEFDEANSLDQ